MAAAPHSIIETRYAQAFPTLAPAEIDRLRRFGEPRSYRAGDRLVTTGKISETGGGPNIVDPAANSDVLRLAGRSGRGRRSSRWCTRFWPTPATAPPCRRAPGGGPHG